MWKDPCFLYHQVEEMTLNAPLTSWWKFESLGQVVDRPNHAVVHRVRPLMTSMLPHQPHACQSPQGNQGPARFLNSTISAFSTLHILEPQWKFRQLFL